MASTVRKNTFILSECKSLNPGLSSGIDRQNVMRLRINRIALVQELKVEHVLHHLTETGVLTKEDGQKVENGTTSSDKTRILIDILPTKGKETEWYKHFRESLQNPDGNSKVKRRYKSLVDFLDNIVIHRPDTQVSHFGTGLEHGSLQLPHYNPLPCISQTTITQNILNLEEDRRKGEKGEEEKGAKDNVTDKEARLSVTLVKGFIQQWIPTPDNYRSLIQIPEDHLKSLQMTSLPEDKIQFQQEIRILERVKKLELVSALGKRKRLPNGFELAMCEVSQDILYESNTYHLYFKYFKMLESSGVNILIEMVNSFLSVMSNLDTAKFSEDSHHTVHLGFCLVELLTQYGYYSQSEAIMNFQLQVLGISQNIELWLMKYRTCVKLMHLHNSNYDFVSAHQAYGSAVEMIWHIKPMSFGENLLDESELFTEFGTLMLEQGLINAAYCWAQNALKVLDQQNKPVVVTALCFGVLVYCACWQVKEAEMLSIYAVQQAKKTFGMRHPLYLKALLHYCHWASEFKQDDHKFGIQIAVFTLETAKKIYGCETIQVALAHRALSKAYLANQVLDKGQKYFHHASEGLRIAQTCLTENHPMLYLFLHTSACSLQWKALSASKEELTLTLQKAEDQAREALELVSSHYGEVSLTTARIYLLIGQIYSKMERMKEAADMFEKSVSHMKLCQPSNSNFLLLAMATLGTFYRIMRKPKKAIAMFKTVVKTVDCSGVYVHWVNMCYNNLISTLQALNNNKEVDNVQVQYSQWLRNNPRYNRPTTLDELNAQPQPFPKFLQDFFILEKKKQRKSCL